jgi:curli biogenesis system outer membrane secretion channel CsgG
MKNIFLLFFVSALFAGCATEISLEDAIEEIAWDISASLEEDSEKTIVVSYFIEDGQISTLSDHINNGLTSKLVEMLTWNELPHKVVSRQALNQLMEEMEFQMSALTDESSQKELGKQLGADLMVTGHITQLEDEDLYRLNVQLIEIETAVVRGGYIYDIWSD